jgi:hypothetical protein
VRGWIHRHVLGPAAQLIPYALVADASPLGLAAAVTVMRTGRLKALAFALGAVGGQFLSCALLVVIGAVTVGHRSGNQTLEALLELGLGIALLVLAVVVRRRPAAAGPSSTRTGAALDRLSRVHALTAFSIGLLLGIGGPKRLVLTGLAAAAITASGSGGGEEAVLVGWYGVLATMVVWVPVLAFVLLGQRAVEKVDSGFEWFTRHRRPVTVWSLVVVGVLLAAGGLAQL